MSLQPKPQPAALPPPSAATTTTTTLKRHREVDVTDAQPIKRRAVLSQDILFRVLVPSKQIGKVIGKVGSRVQKIREDTRASIKIADAITRIEERVVIISSKDNEEAFCDAENALHQIASLILLDDHGNVGTAHVSANIVRLLISGCQAGGLIGQSGQKIENLRNSSGATITVLAQNQLPLCASIVESDRVVQISGDVPAVLNAVVAIGCLLRENPPKEIISISPAYNLAFHRPPPQPYVDPNSAEYITLDMMVPETYVGGLIGRCGSNISRIRTESGATIKVHGGKGEQKHRQVQLGGSAQQVALAKQRIDEYVYSQMLQQPGAQQSLMHDPAMMAAVQAAQAVQPPMYYPPVPPPAPLPYYGQPYHGPPM